MEPTVVQAAATVPELEAQLERTRADLAAAQQQVLQLMAENASQRARYEKEKQELRNMQREYQRVAEYNIQLVQDIQNSRAYKLTKPLRKMRERL